MATRAKQATKSKAKANQVEWSTRRGRSPNVVIVDCSKHITAGWEQWYLLRSDAHTDNPDSNVELQLAHLDEARKRGAGVLDFGDLFCAMQGKYDKRSSKSKLKDENQSELYFDTLVESATNLYEPYADLWVMQGLGNHETSVRVKHETCLIERLAARLRDRTGAPFLVTGYTGWVNFRFKIGKTQHQSVNLWHTHGYGGGGPVTKDMIQRNRQLAYVDNADIICSGHTHDQWVTTDMRLRLTGQGAVEQRLVTVVKCPTYKDEYKTGEGGWHIATGKPPKPLGAYWLRFYLSTRRSKADDKVRSCVKYEIRQAEV